MSFIQEILAALVCVTGIQTSLAQTIPPTILEVQLEDSVSYVSDVPDTARYASDANRTQPSTVRNFSTTLSVSDIVSVNGRAAKGIAVATIRAINFRPSPAPGQAIGDAVRSSVLDYALEILNPDGTSIGSIFASGFGGGTPPAGAPLAGTSSNYAVVGGTGAFLGARGQVSLGPVATAVRSASVTEDPSNRRTHGGGRLPLVVHLIPMERPEIISTENGPGIYHSDFSQVTADRPARRGETLILSVSGLGPVTPNLGPGKPFPAFEEGKVHEVNSPVEVRVNGKAATVANKIGWPAYTNVYRVDFVVPEDTGAGMAAVGLSVAWIGGPEVRFPVR